MAATAPPRIAEGQTPKHPERCYWIEDTTIHDDGPVDHDFGPWFLFPGCSPMFLNPHSGCECDTLAYRHAAAVWQLRDQAKNIRQLRRRNRAWMLAAGEALAVLNGGAREFEVCDQPMTLARASSRARRMTPAARAQLLAGQPRDITADDIRTRQIVSYDVTLYPRRSQQDTTIAQNARVRDLLAGRADTDTITVAQLRAAIDGPLLAPSRTDP